MTDLFGDNVPKQPDTPEARLFNMVDEVARRGGREPDDVRKQLASLKKQFTTERVISALHLARDAKDPLTYARKVLGNAKKRREKVDGREAFLRKHR